MLSAYKKVGQFNYFDTRETKEIVIKHLVSNKNSEYVVVLAVINGKIGSCRQINVFEHGEIQEKEWTTGSKLKRTRIIYNNGNIEQSYQDENYLSNGASVVYTEAGDRIFGELYKGKWHGYHQITEANGESRYGRAFCGSPIGDLRIVSRDGKERIEKYKI